MMWFLWNNPLVKNVTKQIAETLAFQPRILKDKKQFLMHSIDGYHTSGKRTYICEDKTTGNNRGNRLFAMKDEDSFFKWKKYAGAGDEYGLKELLGNGNAVEIDPQTECILLSFSGDFFFGRGGVIQRMEVRVIEGPYEGKVLHISSNYFCEPE